jgi:hypothetical protein
MSHHETSDEGEESEWDLEDDSEELNDLCAYLGVTPFEFFKMREGLRLLDSILSDTFSMSSILEASTVQLPEAIKMRISIVVEIVKSCIEVTEDFIRGTFSEDIDGGIFTRLSHKMPVVFAAAIMFHLMWKATLNDGYVEMPAGVAMCIYSDERTLADSAFEMVDGLNNASDKDRVVSCLQFVGRACDNVFVTSHPFCARDLEDKSLYDKKLPKGAARSIGGKDKNFAVCVHLLVSDENRWVNGSLKRLFGDTYDIQRAPYPTTTTQEGVMKVPCFDMTFGTTPDVDSMQDCLSELVGGSPNTKFKTVLQDAYPQGNIPLLMGLEFVSAQGRRRWVKLGKEKPKDRFVSRLIDEDRPDAFSWYKVTTFDFETICNLVPPDVRYEYGVFHFYVIPPDESELYKNLCSKRTLHIDDKKKRLANESCLHAEVEEMKVVQGLTKSGNRSKRKLMVDEMQRCKDAGLEAYHFVLNEPLMVPYESKYCPDWHESSVAAKKARMAQRLGGGDAHPEIVRHRNAVAKRRLDVEHGEKRARDAKRHQKQV